MKKWQKVQQTSEYFVDGIALVLATLITYLVFGKGLHRILLYTADEWKSYCFMMFVAYSAIAVGFASSIDLAKRQRIMELLAVLRNCSLTYMSFAVLLLVFKNPMIDSRYLFIGSYLLFILFSCLGRYVLKRVLTNNFSNSRNATLVGCGHHPGPGRAVCAIAARGLDQAGRRCDNPTCRCLGCHSLRGQPGRISGHAQPHGGAALLRRGSSAGSEQLFKLGAPVLY